MECALFQIYKKKLETCCRKHKKGFTIALFLILLFYNYNTGEITALKSNNRLAVNKNLETSEIITFQCGRVTKLQPEKLKKFLNPPRLLSKQVQELSTSLQKNDSILEGLSRILQNQLITIQSQDCSKPNILCGHEDNCGFGCQFHHRVGCLMISYALNMPLVHREDRGGWPYESKWSSVLRKLGSNCTEGHSTHWFSWFPENYPCNCTEFQHCLNRNFGTLKPPSEKQYWEKIPFPLMLGFPIDRKFGELIKQSHPHPYTWIVSQFTKYMWNLNPQFSNLLSKWKKEIGWDEEMYTVGIHVRRTDKRNEAPESFHEINEYIIEAEKYFQKIENTRSLPNNTIKRRLFIASDDKSLLQSVTISYPSWHIMGFKVGSIYNRTSSLNSIVRDVYLLSECNFVVCGLTSNICRLVQEILNFKYEYSDAVGRLKALDLNKQHKLLWHWPKEELLLLDKNDEFSFQNLITYMFSKY